MSVDTSDLPLSKESQLGITGYEITEKEKEKRFKRIFFILWQ